MKLFCAMVVCALAMSSAEEQTSGKMIQLCGADLANAFQRACHDGKLDFFNLQNVQHHHQHDHPHGDNHEWKGHAMKRETVTSLVEQCCNNPCHIEDFVSYCPQN